MRNGLEDWDFLLSLLSPQDIVHRLEDVLFYYRVKKISRSTTATVYQDELYNQMVLNHIDLYQKDFSNLFKNHDIQVENNRLRKEIDDLHHSNAYKLGKLILKPIKWVVGK